MCYYPLHRPVIYHHRKSTLKKKISKQWHFVQITTPGFPDCLQTDISNVRCDAQQFVPSFVERVAGVGSCHCWGELVCQEQEQSTSQCTGSHSPFRCQNEIQQLPSTFRSSILWVMLVPKFEIWSFAPNLLPSPLPPFLPKTPFGILDLVEVYFKGFDLFNIKSNFQVMSRWL